MVRRTLLAAVMSVVMLAPAAAMAQAEASLQKCQQTVGKEGEKFIKGRIKFVDLCLNKISIEIIKKNSPTAVNAAKACVKMFRKINDTRALGKSIEEKFLAKVDGRCDPAINDHTEADILGSGELVSEPLKAEKIGNWCGGFGGSGEIDTYAEWRDCILASHKLLADTAVSVQYPRMLEWLDEVRPHMVLVPPSDPGEVTDALAALDAVVEGVAGLADDDRSLNQAGTQFPASGQTAAYTADKLGDPNATVPDDGTVQAGAPLRYVDNGDGTITDLNTQLMWEKKVALDTVADPNNLHDADNRYPWSDPNSPTIWDWLDEVNAEGGGGFAGHSDWRIPNARELPSIVDYERLLPGVDSAFHGASCGGECTDLTDPDCSCTASVLYWSSTTFADSPSLAWLVNFYGGYVFNDAKGSVHYVRAVRGGP